MFDYAERFHTAVAELAGLMKDGRLKSKEDVVVGINTFPETLLKLFNGENFGKLVLQVACASVPAFGRSRGSGPDRRFGTRHHD